MKFIILLGTITALGFELGVDFLSVAVPVAVVFSIIRHKDMEWKTKGKTYQ